MNTTSTPAPASLIPRLSFMMFLQYAIWGAWLPILFPYLLGHAKLSLDQVGAILAAGAVGSILGPFIAGQIADRYFNTEKYLAISHILGAALVWYLSTVTDFQSFLILSLVYGLVYAPTLSLTNSLSFHHLTDRDRQFGPIRLWGTIGWIAAGIAMGHWLLLKYTPTGEAEAMVAAAQNAGRADAFRLSAILGLIMGVYCYTLPRTPPARHAREANATMEALRKIVRKPLIILFLLAIPISVIHQFYFVHTSEFLSILQRQSNAADQFASTINKALGVGGGGLMTIGQMAEILVLALIPFIAKMFSRKTLLGIGIAAYALRMAIFAYSTSMPLILGGVALHGLCFGCFIFVAFMVVDENTSSDVRASAQSLFGLVIFGIGIIVGSWFATSIVGNWATVPVFTPENLPVLNEAGEQITRLDYTRLFSVPMWIAVGCFIILLALYPRSQHKQLAM